MGHEEETTPDVEPVTPDGGDAPEPTTEGTAAVSELIGRKYCDAVLGEDGREFSFRSPTLYQIGEFETRFGGLDEALTNLQTTSIGVIVWILGTREEGFKEEFPNPDEFNKFVDLADVGELMRICTEVFGMDTDEVEGEGGEPDEGDSFLEPDTESDPGDDHGSGG